MKPEFILINDVEFIKLTIQKKQNNVTMKSSKLNISCQIPLLSKGKEKGRYDLQTVNL